MSRRARLLLPRHWLAAFEGKNLVRADARWLGVDRLCAVKELGMLGVVVDPLHAARIERTHDEMIRARAAARARREAAAEAHRAGLEAGVDDDVTFVVGRTSAGFAFGPRWEAVDAPEDRAELY